MRRRLQAVDPRHARTSRLTAQADRVDNASPGSRVATSWQTRANDGVLAASELDAAGAGASVRAPLPAASAIHVIEEAARDSALHAASRPVRRRTAGFGPGYVSTRPRDHPSRGRDRILLQRAASRVDGPGSPTVTYSALPRVASSCSSRCPSSRISCATPTRSAGATQVPPSPGIRHHQLEMDDAATDGRTAHVSYAIPYTGKSTVDRLRYRGNVGRHVAHPAEPCRGQRMPNTPARVVAERGVGRGGQGSGSAGRLPKWAGKVWASRRRSGSGVTSRVPVWSRRNW